MVVDAMLAVLIVADPQGVVRLWNRGAEVIFGYSSGEAIGCKLDLIVPAKLRPGARGRFQASHRQWPSKEVPCSRRQHELTGHLDRGFAAGARHRGLAAQGDHADVHP
jgi:PAS domain S-box-containing protein